MNHTDDTPPPARVDILRALREDRAWDVIVIGGGATGLGTAVDAAARGYRTLLLEAGDFAQGTSSRSTKLLHGGVRYLAQGDLSLVRTALRERGVLKRIAPHLFHELGFVIPAYRWGERAYYGLGLKLYDLLAGSLGLQPSRRLTRAQTLEALPTLRGDGLRGGVLYFDGQFDDARLAISLMRTVFAHGGVALNYCKVVGLIKHQNQVVGVRAQDAETGESFALRAQVVVNATGVWADTVRQMDQADAHPLLRPSQGIHLVFDGSVHPSPYALLVPKTRDGRVIFMTPWHGQVIVGTTDTPRDDMPTAPQPFAHEIDFILDTLNPYLAHPVGRADIRARFAGLRPLAAPQGLATSGTTTAALSREHVLLRATSGLVTVTGGKWTTYRLMAEQTVDLAARCAGLPPRPCTTATQVLHGAKAVPGAAEEPLAGGCGYTQADLRYAISHEMARTAEDVLYRRTRIGVLDEAAAIRLAPRVEALLQPATFSAGAR